MKRTNLHNTPFFILALLLLFIIDSSNMQSQVTTTPLVGDAYGGGIVAHYDDNTKRVVIVAKEAANNEAATNWIDANKWAKELTVGGYDDWRLPTMGELYMIYEEVSKGATSRLHISLSKITDAKPILMANGSIMYSYWSSMEGFFDTKEVAMLLEFHSGAFMYYDKDKEGIPGNSYYINLARAVRVFYLTDTSISISSQTAGVSVVGEGGILQNTVSYANDNRDIKTFALLSNDDSNNASGGALFASVQVADADFVNFKDGIYSPEINKRLSTLCIAGDIAFVPSDYFLDIRDTKRLMDPSKEYPTYNVDIGAYQEDIADRIRLDIFLSVGNKVYDGTVKGIIADFGNAIPGVVDGDQVWYNTETATAEFVDPNAGTGISVVITNLELLGSDAWKYSISMPQGLVANIEKAPQVITFPPVDIEVVDKKYSDKPFNPGVTVDTDFLLTYQTGNINLANVDQEGTITIAGVGEVTITAIQAGTDNYLEARKSKRYNIIYDGSDDANVWRLTVNGDEVVIAEHMHYDMGISPRNTASILIETELTATMNRDRLTVEIIDKPMLKVIEFTITSANGLHTKSYTLTIEKRFNFNHLITTKWNNTLTVINNPDNNGGYVFDSFKWFKNGTEVGTGQYYTAGTNGELLNESDKFEVKLTSTQFEGVLRTSEGQARIITNEIKLHPNPVNRTEAVYLDVDLEEDELNGAILEIYTMTGIKIKQETISKRLTPINISKTMAGIHIFKLKLKDGFTREFKIIVK